MLPTTTHLITRPVPVSITGLDRAIVSSVVHFLLLAGIIVVGKLVALEIIVLVLVSLLLISLIRG